MGFSEWAVLLRADADLAYWLQRIADGPKVRPFAVMRFHHAVESMHAWKHAPSGLYLILISGAPRKECEFWLDGAVRPSDVFTRPGASYRPVGWDECADYVWESTAVGVIPPETLVSETAWTPPPPPPAEWMVHVAEPADLEATLAAVTAFNVAHPDLRLRMTKMVRLANGTKRIPAGLWLITENHDAGTETGLYWKTTFQWAGRAIAADPQSCHTIRRSRSIVWTAGSTEGSEAPTGSVFAVVDRPSSSSDPRPTTTEKKASKKRRTDDPVVVDGGRKRKRHRRLPVDSSDDTIGKSQSGTTTPPMENSAGDGDGSIESHGLPPPPTPVSTPADCEEDNKPPHITEDKNAEADVKPIDTELRS